MLQVAVLIPGFVEKLHKAHAALQQPARQQTIVGEGRLARLGAVHRQDVLRFFGDIHKLRGARLHAIGHLERANAGGDFRIADQIEATLVQAFESFQRVPLNPSVDAGRVG